MLRKYSDGDTYPLTRAKGAIFDQWLWDRWLVKRRASSTNFDRAGVYVYNTKRRLPFIAARLHGHAETSRISESSHNSCSVVNELLWSQYVDNSKRRRRFYHAMLCTARTMSVRPSVRLSDTRRYSVITDKHNIFHRQ